MNPPPAASVVIPSWQGRRKLPRVLEGLARQTLPSGAFETLVVVDGSTDGTARWLRRLAPREPFPLRVLEQANAGAAAARNLGAGEARSPLLIFLDDDVVPDSFFVASHLAAHRGRRPHVAVGIVAWHPALPLNATMRRIAPEGPLFSYHLAADRQDLPYDVLYGANLSMPASLARRFPFDPRFSGAGWEDTELGLRLRKSGIRIVLAPKAVGWHLHRYDERAWMLRQRRLRRNCIRFLEKHPREAERLLRAQRIELARRARAQAAATGEAERLLKAQRIEMARRAREQIAVSRRKVRSERQAAARAIRSERQAVSFVTRRTDRILERQFWSGGRALEGWHAWESSGETICRWSGPRAVLFLPRSGGPSKGRPWTAEIASLGAPGRTLRLRAGSGPWKRFPLRPGIQTLDLGALPPGSRLEFRISGTLRAPRESRLLGIQLRSLRRKPPPPPPPPPESIALSKRYERLRQVALLLLNESQRLRVPTASGSAP